MKKIIKVTQEDIDNGIRSNPYACPVALAITRDTGFVDVKVDRKNITMKMCNYPKFPEELFQELPEEASDFTFMFDRNQSVAPFEFEIEVP